LVKFPLREEFSSLPGVDHWGLGALGAPSPYFPVPSSQGRNKEELGNAD